MYNKQWDARKEIKILQTKLRGDGKKRSQTHNNLRTFGDGKKKSFENKIEAKEKRMLENYSADK